MNNVKYDSLPLTPIRISYTIENIIICTDTLDETISQPEFLLLANYYLTNYYALSQTDLNSHKTYSELFVWTYLTPYTIIVHSS